MTSETLRNMLVKQEPLTVSCCYVCAGTRADYPLFSKSYGDRPFFPFLEHHLPPDGAEPITLDGRVLVCSLCYTFLTQQWESYERSKTPHSKRIYWLKRLDNGPFAGMEMNLQQDYESLFDSSHPYEQDTRQKPSRQNKTFQPSSLENKKTAKVSERSESRDSNVSNISSTVSSCNNSNAVSNALDLSMPSRTSSQSSSASPPPNLETCFVCGGSSKNLCNIFTRPIPNCPFFPSLLLHSKPANAKPMDDSGRVRACDNCYRSLVQQWDFYQRQNVPHIERSYDVKPIPSSLLPSASTSVTVAKQEAVSSDNSFVCFTCGMAAQSSVQRIISACPEKESDPYFSFLLHMSPCPGSEPLSDGKAKVCSLCYKSLSRQLRVFEMSAIPEDQRRYKILSNSSSEEFSVLRQHLKGKAAQSQSTAGPKSVCYLCEKSAESLVPIYPFSSNDMYFPFISTLPKPASAEPSGEEGSIKVCQDCHRSLKFQWDAFENAKIPINQRQYKISKPEHSNYNAQFQHRENLTPRSQSNREDIQAIQKLLCTCCLCSRQLSDDNTQVLETLPKPGLMYFPFIRSYLKLEDHKRIDHLGRVLVCNWCYSLLKNQWDFYEETRVPHIQRQYRVLPPVHAKEVKVEAAEDVPACADSVLRIQVSSPEVSMSILKNASDSEPLLTTVNTLVVSNSVMSSAKSSEFTRSATSSNRTVNRSHHEEGKMRICGPFDVMFGKPLMMNIVCYVCGERSSSTPVYVVQSRSYGNSPFFPFLSKHGAPNGAERLSEDGTALVCILCYHSLVSQYLAYEASPCPEDMNRWQRKYNTYNYMCYVCATITVRQRACSLSIRDFNFLLDHPRPLGALTLMNGECVVVCMPCFESLIAQLREYERLKVPSPLRKYKYITPPERSSSSSGPERSSSLLSGEDGEAEGRRSQPPSECGSKGLPHGPKPPPHVPVQTLYNSKPTSRAIANPVHHGNAAHFSSASYGALYENNSSSASNSSRTSSFAAALRKLAKQAVDPVTEREASPVQSPSLNHQSAYAKHLSSSYVNSNSHDSSSPSPLQTGIGTSQSHGPYSLEKRKPSDLGRYSASSSASSSSAHGPEGIGFRAADYAKAMGAGHDDQRSDSMVERKQSPLYMSHMREERSASRGFQPYRSSEEPVVPTGVPAQVYERSSPASSTYSPHQPYRPPSNLSQPYRLEEPVYMEQQRYAMIRPPAVVPYPPPPPPSNMLPYPGLPFYSSNRYPPELLTQSLPPTRSPVLTVERSKSEDGLRQSDVVRPRDRHLEAEMEREMVQRSREREQREHLLNEGLVENKGHKIYSPLPLHLNRTESPHSEMSRGPPISFTGHHEAHLRKQSPPLSSSSVPLNLVKHSAPTSYPEEVAAWNMKPSSSTSSSHSFSNPVHHKNVFESNTDSRIHHPPPHPPPLIPEGSSDYKSQRNNPNIENISSKSLSVPVYTKSGSHILSRESILPKNNTPPFSDSPAHVNGISIHDIYGHRSLHQKHLPQKQPRDVHTNIQSKRIEHSVKVKSSAAPARDSPVGHLQYMSSDKHLRAFSSGDELIKNNSVVHPDPSSNRAIDSTLVQPQQLLSKDSSITRALLQNHITPSIIEKYMQPPEEVVPRLVSKLDQREVRLAKQRALIGDPDYELSDSESDSEEERRLKEFLIITKVRPMKIDDSPQKLEFVGKLGLTTCSKKQMLELKKFLRRKRMLFELSSASPEDDKTINPILCDTKRLEELSQRLCVEDNSIEKIEFMKMLGLSQKSSCINSGFSELKRLAEIATNEAKLSTESERRSDIAHNEELYEYHHKKRRTLLSAMQGNSMKKPKSHLNGLISNEHVVTPPKNVPSLKPVESVPFSKHLPPTTKLPLSPVPPLIRSEKCEASISHDGSSPYGKSVVSSQDPRVKFLDKTFAQEFHESVLQATQKQLGQKFTSSNSSMELVLPKSPSSQPLDGGSRSSFPEGSSKRFIFSWPGIEAVMESYDYYISEQNMEKEFLADRCQRLRECNQELGAQIACLGQRTSALLQQKTLLDNDQQSLEVAIGNLKAFIHRFR